MTAFYMEWKILFSKNNIKSIIKHWKEIEKKWIIYSENSMYTWKENEFVDIPPAFYLIIFGFMQSYVWNLLKIKFMQGCEK